MRRACFPTWDRPWGREERRGGIASQCNVGCGIFPCGADGAENCNVRYRNTSLVESRGPIPEQSLRELQSKILDQAALAMAHEQFTQKL